ncbi:alkaline phosphatase [Arsukibacterium ikkense]|uniref:Alkaline phosphatase n=1 Tax=Arsukibacterium ikkense TaxID=336831 RepID=A0A0M2V1W2_9GAMM|nr:choice-of-anchor I family protein [Arsukibacterium ikkense]KKO44611.1 alkaline phosphatase [Arsukibacterium ikkense]
MKAKYLLTAVAMAVLTACNSSDEPVSEPQIPEPVVLTPSTLSLSLLGRYSSEEYLVSAAEITAYDADSKRAFVVNALAGAVDVLYLIDPANPVYLDTLSATDIAENAVVNSVAAHNGLIALAIESSPKTERGFVAVYNAADLTLRDFIEVGAQPDMLTFTPDGRFILVANEGEPSDDYQIDPEGSVTVIDVSKPDTLFAATADFRAFNSKKAELVAAGVRIFGPNAGVTQDLEPEYITVSADNSTAWIALQENNALAVLDIASATITDILPLGFKDHGIAGNGIAVSDTQNEINIALWPGVVGMYQPDSIASYTVDGATYIVTANEGDARAWGETNQAYWDGDASQGFVEEIRFKHLFHKNGFDRRVGDDMPPQLISLAAGALLNPEVFGYCGAAAGEPGDCRDDNLLGRLTVSWVDGYRKDANGNPVMFNINGVADENGDRLMYDQVYAFGGRSFAIWSANGELVWDSGDFIEQYLTSDECKLGTERTILCAQYFNANHSAGNSFGNRNDNKGPEPEAIAVGSFGNKTFAFVGLERMGGVMVFDISNPAAPSFIDYLNTRDDWQNNPADVLATVGDLGPEGFTFISADDSPNGKPLLLIGNEVSGTTTIYQINLTY